MIKTLYENWINHLKNNNMNYCKHLVFAVTHGLICLEAGILLIIHGFLPCFFQRVGTLLVKELNKSFDNHSKSRNCHKDRTEL